VCLLAFVIFFSRAFRARKLNITKNRSTADCYFGISIALRVSRYRASLRRICHDLKEVAVDGNAN